MNLLPKILYILHDRDEVDMYNSFFLSHGFAFEGVCSIEEGLHICHINPPDILIVRRMIKHPNDGLTLCQQLRNSPVPLATMPIIMGWADIVPHGADSNWKVVCQQVFEAGANACLGRVYNPVDLLELVELLLADPTKTHLMDRQSYMLFGKYSEPR